MRPDESGAPGDEYSHGPKIGLRMPIANFRLLSCSHTGHPERNRAIPPRKLKGNFNESPRLTLGMTIFACRNEAHRILHRAFCHLRPCHADLASVAGI